MLTRTSLVSRTTRSLLTSAVTLAVIGVTVLGLAGNAAADTVGRASAQAVDITLLNAVRIATGTTTAENDGGADVTNNGTDAVSLLSGQGLLTAGALSTTATARNDGLSYACAGVVQPGGAVSVGADGTSCTSTGTGGGGVTLDLTALAGVTLPAGIGSLQLRLDAVTAYAANNAGTTSGGAALTGAQLYLCTGVFLGDTCLGVPVTIPIAIPSGVDQDLLPAVTDALTGSAALGALGSTVSTLIAPVLTLRVNVQDVDPATDGFRVTALRAGVVGSAVAGVSLAVASAGPNAVPTPMVSGAGWPLGIGIVVLLGVGVVVVRRRRSTTLATSAVA